MIAGENLCNFHRVYIKVAIDHCSMENRSLTSWRPRFAIQLDSSGHPITSLSATRVLRVMMIGPREHHLSLPDLPACHLISYHENYMAFLSKRYLPQPVLYLRRKRNPAEA